MTATIDSPKNERVRAALELRDRSARLATGATLVDGGRECLRAVASGVVVDVAFVCSELVDSEDGRAALAMLAKRHRPKVEILEVSRRVHDRLAFGHRAEGLVLVARPDPSSLATLRMAPIPFLLVTEDVEKPGNLGAILRTADGVGCDAVLAIGGTDLYNPNVIRASAGIVFSGQVVSTTAVEAIAWLRAQGIRPLAARVDAPTAYVDADLRGPLALVVGSESDGLSRAWQDDTIEGVRLPMLGVADSLNVSVAAAVLAFEARRQRDLVVTRSGS